MSITVTRENGRVKIRGSQTYENGMTLTVSGFGDSFSRYGNRARLLDMRHARSWLAGNGCPDIQTAKE